MQCKKRWEINQDSGMTLNQWPFQPTTEDLHKNGKNFPPNFLQKLDGLFVLGC